MISADRSTLGMAVLLGVCGPWLGIEVAQADGTFFKNRPAAVTATALAPAPTTPALGVPPREASRATVEPARIATPVPAAANPPPAPASTTPNEISGAVSDVLSTDTMIVAGQRVQLAGLRGSASLAAPYRRWLQSHGGQLSCRAVAGRYQSAFCENVRYFVSSDAASDWLNRHPDAERLSVADAFAVSRLIFAE